MVRRQSVSIYDVAESVGVAASTVSRAFSLPGRVNQATRDQIMEAADRLGYRPPALRARVSGRVRTVALVVSDIANPNYFSIIRGAERRATAAGLLTILVNTEESSAIERRRIAQLTPAVDALVLASSRLPDAELQEVVQRHAVTLINRQLDGAASVNIDFREGPRQIVEHLASLGHLTATMLAGPETSWLSKQRWKAFSEAASGGGMKSIRVGPFPATIQGGTAAADAGVRSGSSALVAHNDLMAIGIMKRLAMRGVRVPHDLSIVGFDDIFAADITAPGLTTVGGPLEDMGRLAVELLLESESSIDSSTRSIVLPAALTVRGSTGPPRVEHGSI